MKIVKCIFLFLFFITSGFARELSNLRGINAYKEMDNQSSIYGSYQVSIKNFRSIKLIFDRNFLKGKNSTFHPPLTYDPLFYEEIFALYYYTRDGYREINSNLRSLNKYINKFSDDIPRDSLSVNDLSKYLATEALAKVTVSGLNKLSGKKCKAIRATNLDVEGENKVFREIKETLEFTDMAFLSAEAVLSTSHKVGGRCGNYNFYKRKYKFIITSNNCKSISWVSRYKCENEVLFPPGAKFKVDRIDEEAQPIEIYMTHLDS